MSRRKKEQAEGARSPKQQTAHDTLEAFLGRVRELWDQHWPEIEQMIEEDEGSKATVAFSACIDMAESNPKLKTQIKFSKAYKDERLDEIGDPNQMTMPFGEGSGVTLTVHRGESEPPEPGQEGGPADAQPAGQTETEAPKRRGRPRKEKAD